MEVVASLSQGRTAAARCGLFTHKSVPVIFEPPCMFSRIEDVIYVQVMQLEAALAAERKERSSLLEAVNGMHQNMYEPNNPLISDQDGALRVQVVR